MKKFIYSGPFSAPELSAFGTSFFEGKLTPTLKSEEPSPADTAEDVVVLKGKSFNELVLDNDKDVLVEFYAPWCGHCKKLEPIFNDLAAKLKGVSSVRIAKMDATANEIDVEGVTVQGYPSLYFFKGDDKKNPRKFEGGREFDDMLEYIKENAATPFKL